MTIVGPLPVTLQNGTTADATDVMADLNKIRDDTNSNAAKNGANSDITSLTGLTTPLSLAQGGTPVRAGGTSTGSANAQVVATTSPTGFSLTAGRQVTFIAGYTNTGAMTLNVNGTGATNVYKPSSAGPVALTGGEVVVGNEIAVIFDGTQFQLVGSNTAVSTTNYQAFTATGTWTKPANVTASSRVFVQLWGAGGGGGANATGGGGGGGAYVEGWFLASALTATVAVTIPTGGAVNTVGGDTTFGAYLTAYGGGGGYNGAGGGGGGGGGALSAGVSASSTAGATGGEPHTAASSIANSMGGGDGGQGSTVGAPGAAAVTGGGGGGGGDTNSVPAGGGGNSIYGGGGGAGKGTTGTATGGTSVFGGAGGAQDVAGSAPGGGGGRNAAGARGECRVTTFI